MNKNYSYQTTIWENILTQIYLYLVLFTIFAFALDLFTGYKWKNILFYQKFVHLGENTFQYCSRIIAVHVYVNVYSKVHPACHNITNGIKQGSYSKKTDKHAVDYSKAVCWCIK